MKTAIFLTHIFISALTLVAVFLFITGNHDRAIFLMAALILAKIQTIEVEKYYPDDK